MIRPAILFVVALLTASTLAFAQTPRVAVWDPVKGTQEGRFALDLAYLDRVASWLAEAGVQVERVTTEQIGDPQAFSAAKFDALMLEGDAMPRKNIAAMKKFADDGGVLVALGSKIPFLIAIEPQENGEWTMSPKEPRFAWQTGELLGHFQVKYVYDPSRHDLGVNHTSTDLFRRYLPEAPDIRNAKLRGWWIVPFGSTGKPAGEFYPLVRSQRIDGKDVTPQLFIAKLDKRHAIISLNEFYTREATGDEKGDERWSVGRETVVALAHVARDLKSGALALTPEMKIDLPENLAPAEPMRTRLPKGEVNPGGGVTPIARWGRFDGASLELGETVPRGTASEGTLPHALEPGASVTLPLPASTPSSFSVRIRGGFAATGAGLVVRVGDEVAWSELLSYVDASGGGNYGVTDIGSAPAEFHRVAFVQRLSGSRTLTLSNPGQKPVYFDAVQLEPADATGEAGEDVVMGLNYAYQGGWPTTMKEPPAVTQGWTSIRGIARGQHVGPPGDPKRWEKLDAALDRQLAVSPNVHLLLEGTPEWAAINPERYALGKSRNRPHCTAPDPQKYAEIVRHIITKYGDRIDAYEVWNEAESGHFYYGSHEEYLQLFDALSSVIEELDPTAKILTTGMAGFHEDFVRKLADHGALDRAEYFAFHPYAGKSPAWDVPFGLLEGSLYALGEDIEVYCNESGFPFLNAEWFTPPPSYTPALQAQMLDIAIARLMSNASLAKLSVFHAGGDKHHFGLIDEQGQPRPAYGVFADYQLLSRDGGRRIPIGVTPADGTMPLQGVYTIASRHEDGRVTIVVNPSESPVFSRKVALTLPWEGGTPRVTATAEGVAVEAEATAEGDAATVTLEVSRRTLVTLTR